MAGWKRGALGILILFAFTQATGVLFQSFVFEVERSSEEHFIKEESRSLSPYRGNWIPLLILPVAFLVVVNVYLALFRSRLLVRLLKYLVYGMAILSLVVVAQILGAVLLALGLPVPVAPFEYALLIASLLLPPFLLLTGRWKIQVRNALGISLCALVGTSVAGYFSSATVLALLGVLSLFDYYFVLRSRKIVRIAAAMEAHQIPFALSVRYTEPEPRPMEMEAQLGFGDLILATGLAVALYIDGNAASALLAISTTTTALGLFLAMAHRGGDARPYPAMPAVFLGGLVGYLGGILLALR
ncbi:MAG: hypothetical protein HY555_03365 [Euryarchaeota archaeon]|nr:hypothetical protein [Euryarchaeota archaeon]